MPPTGFFIDANLLLLLIVGSVGRDLIAKHRRLRRFTAEDFDRLINLLHPVEQVFVTLAHTPTARPFFAFHLDTGERVPGGGNWAAQGCALPD